MDRICLGDGDDTADGADKQDFIMGGDGNDTLDGDNFPSLFRDNLYGEAGDDIFTGGQGNDRMFGGSDADAFDIGGVETTTISEGADVIDAGSGDDEAFEDDGFVDTIKCGPGTDTVIVDSFDKTTSCENKTVDPVIVMP